MHAAMTTACGIVRPMITTTRTAKRTVANSARLIPPLRPGLLGRGLALVGRELATRATTRLDDAGGVAAVLGSPSLPRLRHRASKGTRQTGRSRVAPADVWIRRRAPAR